MTLEPAGSKKSLCGSFRLTSGRTFARESSPRQLQPLPCLLGIASMVLGEGASQSRNYLLALSHRNPAFAPIMPAAAQRSAIHTKQHQTIVPFGKRGDTPLATRKIGRA